MLTLQYMNGSRVEKVGGDYRFSGVIVAIFWKKSGALRIVVENDDGILHIFSPANVGLRDEDLVAPPGTAPG